MTVPISGVSLPKVFFTCIILDADKFSTMFADHYRQLVIFDLFHMDVRIMSYAKLQKSIIGNNRSHEFFCEGSNVLDHLDFYDKSLLAIHN